MRNTRPLLYLPAVLWLLTTVGVWAQDATAIYLTSPDGKRVRKLAEAPGFKRVGHPRFSHDGKRLAFHGWEGPQGVRRVFVVGIDGAGLRQIESHGQLPDWSPDDRQLVVQNVGEGGARIGAWVENLDGDGRNFLVAGFSPRWAPDGRQLAFIDNRRLFVRDLIDETEASLLDADWEQVQTGFDWSASRNQIAFVGRRQGKTGLWIIGVGDPKPRLRLVGNLMGQVAWSPDGKQLAVTLNGKLQLLNSDDKSPPRVIPGQIGNSRDPAWSPDGAWIGFSSNRDLREIKK